MTPPPPPDQGTPTPQTPMRVVVVGGGTAGWMAAAAIVNALGRAVALTLIESDAIGTVGVGEATIPQIHNFNTALGLDEDAFVRATQGTFKLAIEFVGWGTADTRYMHAFGAVGRDVGSVPFRHYWARAMAAGAARPLGAHSLNEAAARDGRMQRGEAQTAAVLPAMPYAFHFDAGLYAAFLRQFAELRGVARVEGEIVGVDRDGATGNVASVTLSDGRAVAGDLFIDCSGFRGLLIEGALAAGYDDWSRWLPCDRAMAMPTANVGDPDPFTRSTAHATGWQWRIPLQHRTGNGIVYASAAMDDDAAATHLRAHVEGTPLGDPRPLRFTTGKRRRAWSHNVVALGLAAGFMEPLESTSIHLVQSGIGRLLQLWPGDPVDPVLAREFNRQTDFEWTAIRDFLILHYHANRRDEPFWRDLAAMAVPDSLSHRIDLFRASGQIVREHEELFTEEAWVQVLVGQGIVPRRWHPLADAVPGADLAEYCDTWERLIAREVAQMPTHAEFIARHCAAPQRMPA